MLSLFFMFCHSLTGDWLSEVARTTKKAMGCEGGCNKLSSKNIPGKVTLATQIALIVHSTRLCVYSSHQKRTNSNLLFDKVIQVLN